MRISMRSLSVGLLAAMACGFPRPADVGDDTSNTAYQLVALEPATATTGDTITLEGTFGQTAIVHFPGNASQPANVLGPHRATGIVPAGATAGGLTVETGGTMVGPLPFRRTSFALGLQAFEEPSTQVNGARQGSTLVMGRSGHTAAVIGNVVYVLGGYSGGSYLDSVERATINADGSLGPFAPVPGVALATARSGHTTLVMGSFLYVLGGSGSNGVLNSVERATIAVDGSLGPFTNVTGVVLTSARDSATTAVVGNTVYVIGGIGTGVLKTVERATINPDGSLGPFAVVTGVSLATARSGHTSAVVGSTLYVLGGSANSTALNSVERAPINADGSLGTFETVTEVSLSIARSEHTSAVVGNFLYALGGTNSNGRLNSVERAAISPDGSLGSFLPVSNATFSAARSGHTSVAIGNFLYQIGGSSGVTDLTSVERASINADGLLAPFATVPDVTLTGPRGDHATAVIGHYLYALGGTAGGVPLTNVERAQVNADGSLGPFTVVPGVTLAVVRAFFTSAVIGNYLYVVGGVGNVGSLLTSVERAPIAVDGSLGPFTVVSDVALITARAQHTGVIVRGFLYVFGGDGFNGGGAVERAPIAPDGSLGPFAIVPGVSAARSGHMSIAIGSFVYVLGGVAESTTGTLPSVERAAIMADGSLSPFAPVSGLALVEPYRLSAAAVVVGSSVYVLPGFGVDGTVERATINPDGSLKPFATVSGITLTTVNNGYTAAIVGNSLYVLGGFIFGDAFASVSRAQLTP
jgi:Kelch motif protein